MKLFRNPEVKISVLAFSAIAVLGSAVAFIWDMGFGIFTVSLCAVFIGGYIFTSYRRYKRIAELSQVINKILHGDNSVSFDKYSEGELSILQTELYKMTVRLREQQQSLLNDKIYLSNSIADISHQIKTPLTSVNILLSFLAEPDISETRREELVRELFGRLKRIDWLVTTLMKISKLDAGTVQFKNERVNMSELIKTAVEPLLVSMELHGQELLVSAEGVFEGDIAWTSEAIENIVKNCMEHTKGGGRIEICTKETVLYSEIAISDNGSGIDKEDLPHIFERFYKGKNAGENGFGIGLALARMIVTQQNGTVKAENRIAGGASFTIRFYKEVGHTDIN